MGFREKCTDPFEAKDTCRRATYFNSDSNRSKQVEIAEHVQMPRLYNFPTKKRDGSGFGIWGRFTHVGSQQSLGSSRCMFDT